MHGRGLTVKRLLCRVLDQGHTVKVLASPPKHITTCSPHPNKQTPHSTPFTPPPPPRRLCWNQMPRQATPRPPHRATWPAAMEMPMPSPFLLLLLPSSSPGLFSCSSSLLLPIKGPDQAPSLAKPHRSSSSTPASSAPTPIRHCSSTPTSTTPQRASPRARKAP